MAFGTAAGYGNLPSGNFAPQIFSQKVLKFFRRASVAEDITNTDYTGELKTLGHCEYYQRTNNNCIQLYKRFCGKYSKLG